MLRKATKDHTPVAQSLSTGLKIKTQPILRDVDGRWTEFRVAGKNIVGRSQHVAVIYDGWMYVHGGTNADLGILSDFCRINLSAKEFVWQRLTEDLSDYPGKLKGHSAVLYEHHLYLFGGQANDNSSSNLTYRYNFLKDFWKVISGEQQAPRLESHNAVVHGDAMYALNGYMIEQAKLSANIYKLDLKSQKWSTYYRPEGKSPIARSNSSVLVVGDSLWMFGGTDGNNTLNDLWRFGVNEKKWVQVATNDPPVPRRSCSMLAYRDHLIVFGGIQDVTKELNDIFAYSLADNHWSKIHSNSNSIYECSPTLKRPTELKVPSGEIQDHKSSISKKQSILHQRQPSSPEKNTDAMKRIFIETKLKKFEERKRQLLKDFQDDKNEPVAERRHSPTTQNLIKTIKSLGDQSNNRIVVSHQVRYDPSHRFIVGKKPCARDAHTVCLNRNQMLIFGGDRHLMCFNDLYYFDLDKGIESKSLYDRATT